MGDDLKYVAPPKPAPEETVRRVYVLPVEMVKRIHAYGFDNGHQNETSAVRELLEAGLPPKF